MKKSFCLFLMILLAISMFVGCNPSPKVLKSIAVTKEPTAVQYQGFPLNTTGIEITGTYSDNTTQVLPVESFAFNPSTMPTSDTDIKVIVTVTYSQNTTINTKFEVTALKEKVSSIAVAQNPTKTEYVSGETLDLTGLIISVSYNSGKETTITDGFTTEPKNGATLSTSDTKVTVTYGGQQTSFNITVKPVASKDTTLGAKDSWFTTLVAGDIATKNEIVAIEFTTGLDLPKETVFRVKDVDLTEKKTGLVKGYITEDYKVYVVGQTITANADSEGMFAGFTNMETFKADNLNTINVTNMNNMFKGCSEVKKLNLKWKTDKVEKMNLMFDGCKKLEELTFGDDFDTSRVITMIGMFNGCSNLEELDVSSFDTERVLFMNLMFSGCSKLEELDLDDFDTSRVTNMVGMFKGCTSLTDLDLSSFDTGLVLDMTSMFQDCKALEDINCGGFETRIVASMGHMFENCSSLEKLDLGGWKTGKVLLNVSHMFDGCRNLKTIYVSEDFKIPSAALDLDKAMFKDCVSIVGGSGKTTYDSSKTSKDYAIIDGTDGKEGYLTDARVTHTLPKVSELWNAFSAYTDFDKKKVKSVRFVNSIGGSYKRQEENPIELAPSVKGYKVYDDQQSSLLDKNPRICIVSDLIVFNEDCKEMFNGFTSATSIYFGDAEIDTSLVEDMSSMFESCTDLEYLDLRRFDTSNVTNMDRMFKGCTGLKNVEHTLYKFVTQVALDLSKFKVDKITETPTDMFKNCALKEGSHVKIDDDNKSWFDKTALGDTSVWEYNESKSVYIRKPKAK